MRITRESDNYVNWTLLCINNTAYWADWTNWADRAAGSDEEDQADGVDDADGGVGRVLQTPVLLVLISNFY